MNNTFSYYYKKAILNPTAAFEQLETDSQKLKWGFMAVLISAVLYTFVYLFGADYSGF